MLRWSQKCSCGQGINVSGGQKQRISLARAVYRDADVYILDDILSAVDVHVGQHLLEQCVCGALQDKTRIFATNQLHTLPNADKVIVLDRGEILEQGTYEELMKAGGWLAGMVLKPLPSSEIPDRILSNSQLLVSCGQVDSHSSAAGEGEVPVSPKAAEESTEAAAESASAGKGGAADANGAGSTLVKTEARKAGAVTLKTYSSWFTAGGSKTLIISM